MQVIGKGKLLWNKYTEYVSKENERSARKEAGWYEKVRYMVPSVDYQNKCQKYELNEECV